jgi:hypothetical protein
MHTLIILIQKSKFFGRMLCIKAKSLSDGIVHRFIGLIDHENLVFDIKISFLSDIVLDISRF